ncbi:30S ribosomal protein S19 [Candidatus Woesearchaeota archaeon]|nr:30S ribosomal protein S19 [Candidatus Woesearchaeota archaeon]
MVKKFTFKGYTIDELKQLDYKEVAKILPSRQRRSLLRGFTEEQKKLLKKIDKVIAGQYKKPIKTHCRDMIILPKMVDLIIHLHKGNAFIPVQIQPESIGMYLGELLLTRQRVQHSAPGVGATKSSAAVSVK